MIILRSLQPAILYLYSRTIEGREASSDENKLAKIDLITRDNPCRLVLGLNNHHTISYYWAQAEGYGSCMDAIGVTYNNGILQWSVGSNSNDGKRSEWVNFLRKGDEVQLILRYGIKALLANKGKVYGVSSKGRPKGSEPAVACQFDVENITLEPDHANF